MLLCKEYFEIWSVCRPCKKNVRIYNDGSTILFITSRPSDGPQLPTKVVQQLSNELHNTNTTRSNSFVRLPVPAHSPRDWLSGTSKHIYGTCQVHLKHIPSDHGLVILRMYPHFVLLLLLDRVVCYGMCRPWYASPFTSLFDISSK